MKKFTDFSKNKSWKRINEDDQSMEIPAANLPQIGEQEEEKQEEFQEISESTPANLFSRLFESREMVHIYHLQAKGDGAYAAHMALGGFYEGVIELIDDLIETYQGQYGIVEGYELIDTKNTNSKDKIEYLKELADFIKSERKCINVEDSHLHNIIDEIVALTYRTLYKLTNLN